MVLMHMRIARILGNTRFLVVRRATSRWLPEASIKTRKYQKEHEGGLMGPQMSP